MIFGLQFLILCCHYFTYSISYQISPQQPYQRVLSTNKLSIRTPNTPAMQHFAFPFVSLRSSLILLSCDECNRFFVSLFSFDWFNSSLNFAAFDLLSSHLVEWIIVILAPFTHRSSVYFVFSYSAVFIIRALYFASICNRSLPFSFLPYTQPTYISFGWYYYYDQYHHHQHHIASCHTPSHPATSPHKTNSYPQPSGLMFQTAALSVFCVIFQLQLFLFWIYWMFSCFVFVFWPFLALPVIGHTAVVPEQKLTSVSINWIWIVIFN